MLTREEAQSIAEQAAGTALKEFFRFLDIDVSEDDNLRNFRDDLHFLHSLRDFKEDLAYARAQRLGAIELKRYIKNGAWTLAIGAIPGALWLFWNYVKDGLRLLSN